MTRTNSCAKSGQEKCKSRAMNAVQSSLLVHPYQTSLCNNAALVVVRRHSDQQLQSSNRLDNPVSPDRALTNNEMWSKESNGGHPVTWPDTASQPQEQTNNTTMSLDIPLKSTGTTITRTEGQQQPASKRRRSNQLTHRRGSRVRLRFALNKERKASTTLGIIMSAFTLCWFPFFVLALVRPFMSHQTASLVIPRWLSSLFLWLGYANSFLNPVIYATTNKDFRLPFREILCLRCKSLNSVMREDFYQSQYGNNQQLMDATANNNKSGLMAGQASSPSSSSSTSHPKGNRRRRHRRCSTESVGMEHNNRKMGNAAPEEDDATDYGLMTAGHRESSSSATAFL
ncbi:hypothetical protein GHT06_021087 [Daphnia sinensis]|uniref:G-protein coupled receptors family 1 profile domain-containing protein n=1 Tax=Daphnia sinensis TaxID=1820382 RepID=A0AAD5L017_9CRUS|nr:hypothetical protein GHT06_021087 [Daphnia sinensis]